MQKPVQLQPEPPNIFCAGNTECLYLDELRIAYHLIQYLEDFSRNAVGDCAAAEPVKLGLRGGSRGNRAFLLSTLLYCLKLLRR